MEAASRIQGAVQSISGLFSKKKEGAVAPQLSNPIRYPFGEFEFQMRAVPGQPVELQVSSDFKKWETLDTLTPAKELSIVSDKKAGSFGALFYRACVAGLQSNYLGFLAFEIPPGYSMISNPFISSSPLVSDLLSSLPEGSSVTKYNLVTYALDTSTLKQGRWSNPHETLKPGEGALINNPAGGPVPLRFVGDIPKEPQSIPVQQGMSMRGSLLPLAGQLDTDLGFPISEGDVVSVYKYETSSYAELKFTQKGWESEKPKLRLGEGFWVAKNTAGVWTQQLPDPSQAS